MSTSCFHSEKMLVLFLLSNIDRVTVITDFGEFDRKYAISRLLYEISPLSLVTAPVLSRVDYGNATLAGLPARQLCRLQSVLHAAARIVFLARKFDHVTPLLRELHWLRIPERITFKLSCLVFRSLNGTTPVYLADSINRATDVTTRRSLRSS